MKKMGLFAFNLSNENNTSDQRFFATVGTGVKAYWVSDSGIYESSIDVTGGSVTNDGDLYLHVLGLKRVGRGLLAAMASHANAPVILRHSDLQNCSELARASLAIDALSTDLYAYALGKELHRDAQSAITV